MEAKLKLAGSKQEEQIRAALDAHRRASADGDANAEHDIYDDAPVARANPRVKQSTACGVIIPASRRASRSSGSSETGIPGSRDTPSPTRPTAIHGEYYGVPQRQGHQRNTVFRGSLRGARAAEAMGSTDGVKPR